MKHLIVAMLIALATGVICSVPWLIVGCDKTYVDAPEVSPCLDTMADITVIHYGVNDTTETPLRQLIMQLGQGCDVPHDLRDGFAVARQMQMTGWAIKVKGNDAVAVGFVE